MWNHIFCTTGTMAEVVAGEERADVNTMENATANAMAYLQDEVNLFYQVVIYCCLCI